jgi:O-antigen/teichoic acid export membrane protein
VANAPISMIAGIANQLMVPIIFNRAGTLDPASSSDAHRLISILTGIYVVVSIAFVIIAYWFGIDIMRLLTTAEMAAYGGYLWIIVAGLAISNLGQVGVLRGLSEGDSARYSWPKAIQAGTLIALIVPMVHRFGFPGIAWSLFASSVAYIFSVVTVNRRKSRIRRVRYG